jgi:hypothetical protein
MTAYLDKMTGSIITTDEWKALDLDAYPSDLDLEVVHKGPGEKGIACECELCGSPLGSLDPDRAAWIRMRICADCRC